jgi:hypothetical protein
MMAAAFVLGVSSGAQAFLLPTPENNTYATYSTYPDATGVVRDVILMNGIPIAIKYDDFWSYSAQLLDAIQTGTNGTTYLPPATFGAYDFTVGTGTIAVNITSVAGGATNIIDVGGVDVQFQDPVDLASSNAATTDFGWTGVWGGNTQIYDEQPPTAGDYTSPAAAEGGTSTVGEMLTYLDFLIPGATVPVFYADYNQTGAEDSLWMSAKFQVFDGTSGALLAEWDLDAITNTAYDVNDPTFNYATVSFFSTQAECDAAGAYDPVSNPDGCAGVTTNGVDYVGIDHNLGSGKPDFLAYAPTMDLGNTAFTADDLFVVTIDLGCSFDATGGFLRAPIDGDRLGCNTNGGEEFGIVGAVGRQQQVPEPGVLALAGLGLLGMGFARRRRAQA